MFELMLLLEQGETDLVLEKCNQSNLPERSRNLVRARVAMQLNDKARAEPFFKKALDPVDFYGYLDYALTRLAKLQLQSSSPRDALRTINKGLSHSPGDAVARDLQLTAMIQLALAQSAPALQQKNYLRLNSVWPSFRLILLLTLKFYCMYI